ncbi:cyclin-J-like [Anneissia japonica]|uniref:cyclin-J-like n=1 Tax=Anneissia japonica TaxID=1529436 RepID=UPI001425A8D2|nr:cyclin-J-like [Anneissia japonica]XP_033113445.1 cyclin-J-like [Anneissia japonica]XP_033113446.1 cyclin-J-like [Anneissia japonica]XP_033113447.1 cyclin-J-like [Anneissia japonica]
MTLLREQWTESDLASDIHQTLKAKEKQIAPFYGNSPQLGLRRFLVDWLAIISEKYELAPYTLHLSIYCMDRFMDKYDIKEATLHLVALSCLVIATKYEEKEDKVIHLCNFNSCAYEPDKKGDYLKMELLLLDFFSWQVSIPTAVHFMDYYIIDAVCERDLHAGQPLSSLSDAVTYMQKYTKYFLDISLQDHVFSKCMPSLVAASCIAASRVCLKLAPTWTSKLRKLTKYSWEHIAPCIEKMLIAHEIDEKAAETQADSSSSAASTQMAAATVTAWQDLMKSDALNRKS